MSSQIRRFNFIDRTLKLKHRTAIIAREILSREKEMNGSEAKIFLNELNQLREEYFNIQTETATKPEWELRVSHHTITTLKEKLATIISRDSSTSSTQVNQNNRSSSTNQQKTESGNYRDLESRIQEQKFLVNQIECVEIEDGICDVKARVLHDHLDKLYDRFVRNQIEMNTQVDNTALEEQQTISIQVQQKIIDKKTKLQKIIATNASISTPTAESKPSNQIHQVGDRADLHSFIKNSNFLIDQMRSLEPEGDICENEARITFDHLASLYETFLKNQMKVEEQIEGTAFEMEPKITKEVQRYVIRLQTKLKNIFDPTPAHLPNDPNQIRSTTEANSTKKENEFRIKELNTVNHLISLLEVMLVSDQGKFGQCGCKNDSAGIFSSNSTLSSTSAFDKDDLLGIFKIF